MLTRRQQILLKRAQADAGLADEDYRDALEKVTGLAGCRSSKDDRLSDGHLDNLLSFFEAIYWQQEGRKESKVFSMRGYWASRNRRGDTSRDRFTQGQIQSEIADLEEQLAKLGFGKAYVGSIRWRIQPPTPWAYKAALERTLKSKQRAAAAQAEAEIPF